MATWRRSTLCSPRVLGVPVVSLPVVGLAVMSLAVVGALTLTGCAPGNVPAAAVPPEPSQVLGGECSALFPDAVVSEVLGTSVTARDFFIDSPNAHSVSTLGGLSCEWSATAVTGTEAVDAASVSAVVLNSDLAGTASETVSCYTGAVTASNDDASACRFSAVAGNSWLSGVVYAATGAAEEDTRAAVATLVDGFTAIPTGESHPPSVPATTWRPPGCAELSEAAGVAATLQSPDLVGSDVALDGPDSAEGLHAANARAGTFACAWHQSGTAPTGQLDGFSIQGLPGGAWVHAQVLAQPGAAIVDVPGVDLAVRVPTAVGHEMLDVFDGGNWLQIARADGLDPILPVLPALLDALNAATGESSE